MSSQSASLIRQINHLAWPIICANITVPLLALVDTIVLGHLPDHRYLATVALGDVIFSFIYLTLGFLRMGTSGFCAQALGKQDFTLLRSLLAQFLLIALSLALLLILCQQPLARLSLYLLTPPAELHELIRTYFNIRIWATPATLGNAVISGWLLGIQRTRSMFLITATINGVAIVLDIYFVYGLHLNVRGIALAVTAGQYSGLALGLLMVYLLLADYPGLWAKRHIIAWQQLKMVFHTNRHLFVRSCCLMFVLAFVMRQGAQFGSIMVAVNSILMTFQHLLAYSLDGFANATESLVGHAVGQNDSARLQRIVRSALILGGALALAYSLFYLCCGNWLVNRLTDLEAVRIQMHSFLPWAILAPIISVWAYLFDGVFVGATLSSVMRNTMIVSALGFAVVWYFSQPLGNHGLWLALMVFLALRGLSLGTLFYFKYKET